MANTCQMAPRRTDESMPLHAGIARVHHVRDSDSRGTTIYNGMVALWKSCPSGQQSTIPSGDPAQVQRALVAEPIETGLPFVTECGCRGNRVDRGQFAKNGSKPQCHCPHNRLLHICQGWDVIRRSVCTSAALVPRHGRSGMLTGVHSGSPTEGATLRQRICLCWPCRHDRRVPRGPFV